MTSFTAASGPLDDARRALQLVSDTADSMRRLETRALQVDETVSFSAKKAADSLDEAFVRLFDAVATLQELEQLILGRSPGEET